MAANRLKSELLSAVATEEHIVTTSPRTNAIQIWDKRTRELIKIDDLEEAAGIVLSVDKSEYIVTSGYEHKAIVYRASDSEFLQEEEKFKMLTGRHTLISAI